MAVKYDTMINLMPDMWLMKHQDLDEDDIDEYGRLVIDIPEPPDNADNMTESDADANIHEFTNAELRGNQPDTEKETCNSIHNTPQPNETKSQKILPLRINRNIPIKLLLKRSFQNSRTPHKKRLKVDKIENEIQTRNKSVESHKNESLPTQEHNINKVVAEERTGRTNIVENDVKQSVGRQNYNMTNTTNVSHEKHNTVNGSIKSHIKELLSTTSTIRHNLNRVETQEKTNVTNIVANYVYQKVSRHNDIKIVVTKQNTPNESIKSRKEELSSTHKHCSNKFEQETTVEAYTSADNVDQRASPQNYTKTTKTVTLEKLNTISESMESHKDDLLPTHQLYPNQAVTVKKTRAYIVAEDADERATPQNNKENNEKAKTFALRHSSTSNQSYQTHQPYQTPQLEPAQRISVVSNDFLFQHRSKRGALGRPTGTNSQSLINSDPRSPQMYQEALIDFMERQYQLAIRDNIPLTVNTKPVHQEPLGERCVEVINIGQRTCTGDVVKNNPSSQQPSNKLSKQNISKNTPTARQDSSNPDNQSGYNILVHRGPDINRIVITIANETEINKKITNKQYSCGDQRVPESINNQAEASPPSQKKRSYYYKEPTLRNFRKRYPHLCAQKQIRNTIKKNRSDQSDYFLDNHNNVTSAQHYSYLGNHYELPTPVIENYYTLGVQNCLHPVTHALYPWEIYDREPIVSDRISSRTNSSMRNISSSQNHKQYHTDQHEQLFGPLNLSLKPLTVDERPYPEMYPKYPVNVQDYY